MILVRGDYPVNQFYNFNYWYSIKVERDSNGVLQVKEILSDQVSKENYQANESGFVLLIHVTDPQYSKGLPDVGDYVTVDFTVPESGVYNSAGYGSVIFSKEAPSRNSIPSAPTKVLQYQENGGRVAHTSDFIDLNLYNYNYSVNDNWRSNQYYPGFQWPGAAYTNDDNGWSTTSTNLNIGISNWRVDRRYIDSVSFGDSLVANHQYADSHDAYYGNSNYVYGKAGNATNVGKVYDTTAAQSVGKINWLWYSGSYSDDSVSNRPAGYIPARRFVTNWTMGLPLRWMEFP